MNSPRHEHPADFRTFARASEAQIRVGLFGCPPATGNRGVDALRFSVLSGLARARPDRVEATVFGYGRGIRYATPDDPSAHIRVRHMGAYFSRRLTSPSNLQQILIALRVGAGSLHPRAREIQRLDAVLDISGGDSFADIYGPRRFRGSTLTKQVVLATGVPLVLLPQTYGPYRSPTSRRAAGDILRRAARAWARDPASLEVVRDLLGSSFDPARHSASVDVAFCLESLEPSAELRDAVLSFAEKADVLVALNVSGLLFNVSGYAEEHFDFRGDYRRLIMALVEELLERQGARIILVPHVESQFKHECDATACESLFDSLPSSRKDRVLVVPRGLDARELKWIIGQADWACATRMHAAVAAISQGIPTAAIAYSDKTMGVFETAGMADAVADPRLDDNPGLLERVRELFAGRGRDTATLTARLPGIRAELDRLFESVVRLARGER